MIARIVRFKSALSDEQVRAIYEERSSRYREVPGLVQKYYLHFRETGEHGAVYIWDSLEALEEFTRSDLARTIPEAYRVQGSPRAEMAEIVLQLWPEPKAA